MLIGRVVMTSVARRTFTVNFPWLATGESIINTTVDILPDDGLFNVYDVAIVSSGRAISYQVSGSGQVVNGDEYKATITVQTDQNQINDDCIIYAIDCGGCC